MHEIYNLHYLVRETLEMYPDTRNSDTLLYVTMCKNMNPKWAKLPMETAMLQRKELGMPKYESVSRARRKIQHKDKTLRGTATVSDRRYDNYKIMRDYALEE